MADVRSDRDELLLQAVERVYRCGIGLHLTSHLPKPESKGGNLLQNAIVQFSGDAHPFRLLRFDQLIVERTNLRLALLESADPKTMHRPEQDQNQRSTTSPEPCRTPPWRQDRDAQTCSFFVPDAPVVAALNLEHVLTRRQRISNKAVIAF